MVAADIGGVDSAENRSAAFGFSEAWANGVDGGVARRLNDEEAREVRDLVVRYHVESIRKASQSTENAETVIGAAIAESEENNCVDNNVLESVAIALQDTVRHVNMAVTATEVVEKLGLEQDPDIRVIFHPLILSYTRFVASFSNDAILFLRGARTRARRRASSPTTYSSASASPSACFGPRVPGVSREGRGSSSISRRIAREAPTTRTRFPSGGATAPTSEGGGRLSRTPDTKPTDCRRRRRRGEKRRTSSSHAWPFLDRTTTTGARTGGPCSRPLASHRP